MHYTKHLKLPMNQRANLPHCIAKMHFWTLANRPSKTASVEFEQILAVNESDICFQHCQSPGSENLLQELDFVNHDMLLHHCMRLLQGFISRIYSQQVHVWGLTLPFPPLETSRTRPDGSRSLAWEKTQVQQMKRRKNTVALPDAKTCGRLHWEMSWEKQQKKRNNTNFEVSQPFRVVKLLKNFISIGMWILALIWNLLPVAPFLQSPSARVSPFCSHEIQTWW